jgi:2-aminoadipate transaminase
MMAQPLPTADGDQGTAELLTRLWADRDLTSMLGGAARAMNAGSATDWGMPAPVDAAPPPITLGGGIPDPGTLPRSDLLAALGRVLEAPDDGPLRYGGALGYEPLREAIAARSARAWGVPLGAEHVMLTNGSAGAIDVICSTLIDAGDVIVVEAPTFSGSTRTFRGHGAEIISVPVDRDGMDVDALAPVLARLAAEGRRAKLVYTIANYHNPTGATLSLPRRHRLLRLAAEHGALVMDDDAYGEIAFDEGRPPSLAALAGGRGVITVGTFSKVIATGLRVGWILTDPALVERMVTVRFDMGNSPLLHRMLAEYMAGGRLDAHVAEMRPIYASRARALQDALREYAEPYLTFVPPRGGFFLWVRLQDGLTAPAVQRAAMEEGASFPVGHAFFAERGAEGERHIRLAYSTRPEEDLREAARRIGRACERVAAGG